MKPVQLKEGIYWVGAVDWAVRDFHGYITPRGSTYNNYLVLDEEPTLLDGVKAGFEALSLANIRALIEPSRIRHLVVNHVEPDHSGGLPAILSACPQATVYCSKKGQEGLQRFFDTSGWRIETVKTGDTLKIGKRTLLFIETPMIHWPDSMMTFIQPDGVLVSQDGFGQHLASSQRFDDEFVACASQAELEDAVWDYYANILMPFGTLIKRKIKELKDMGLEIQMIAPDHGVVWRSQPQKVLKMYLDMASGWAEERVLIIYDTMWGATGKLTQAIAQGARDQGMDVRVLKLRATPVSVAVKEFWRARATLLGSPTLNNTVFPHVGELLYYLKGLRPKDRLVGAFGTFGWAGGATKEILQGFRDMGLEVFPDALQVRYLAKEKELQEAYAFGARFAQAAREFHQRYR
jgi:flavorubredoxin